MGSALPFWNVPFFRCHSERTGSVELNIRIITRFTQEKKKNAVIRDRLRRQQHTSIPLVMGENASKVVNVEVSLSTTKWIVAKLLVHIQVLTDLQSEVRMR